MITNFLSVGLEASFYIMTLIFVGFSLSAAYHWLSYGTSKTKTMLALTIYLGVSAPLFITMLVILATL